MRLILELVEDQANGVTPPATDETDSMPHRHFPDATLTHGRPLVDGEYDRVALAQRDDIGVLTVRRALRHNELTTHKIPARFG